MNTQGYKPLKIDDLRGAQPEIARTQMDPTRAMYVRNMNSVVEGIRERDGFKKHLTSTGVVRAIHHWTAEGIINPDRLLLFKDDRTLSIHYNQLVIADQVLATFDAGTNNVSITEQENRLYVTPRNGLYANGGVHIAEPADSIMDKAFMPPFSATLTPTDDGTGETTPGLHKFALLGTSRTGFRGKLSPVVGSAFTPVEFTVTSPDPLLGRKIKVHVSIPPTPELAVVELAMTTDQNPNRWLLVPDASAGVSPGGLEFDFTVDIADDTLTSLLDTDVEVTDYQSWITRDPGSSNDPIGCYAAIPYGDRMVYLCGTVAYISEIGNPQQISADQHVVRMTGGKFISAGFSLRGSFYLAGPKMVEGITDSRNAPPVAWVPPATVGGTMGVPAQNCIAVTIGQNSGSSYAIIANQDGLWYFDGNFSQKPITWRTEQIWKRVNWAAVHKIRIVDDTYNRMVLVLAPIDGATEANKIMVFDYSRSRNEFGMIPSSMDYYEFDIGEFTDITTISIFQDYQSNRMSLMAAVKNGSNSDLMYQVVGLKTDNDIPFTCEWENGSFAPRDKLPVRINRFAGAEVMARGDGILRARFTVQGDDDYVEYDIELEPSAKINWQEGFRLNGQNIRVKFTYSTLGTGILISMAKVWVRPISNAVVRRQ